MKQISLANESKTEEEGYKSVACLEKQKSAYFNVKTPFPLRLQSWKIEKKLVKLWKTIQRKTKYQRNTCTTVQNRNQKSHHERKQPIIEGKQKNKLEKWNKAHS